MREATLSRCQTIPTIPKLLPDLHRRLQLIWSGAAPGEYLSGPLVLRPLSALFCRSPLTRALCVRHITDWTGPHWHLNESRVGLFTAHSNAGTSMLNMLHYYQSLDRPDFQMYDFGAEENRKRYGQVRRTCVSGNTTVSVRAFRHFLS